MAQKGVTLCAMSLGNETHTTLVGGLGSGGEHCCLLKVPDRSRDCMLLMTFYLGIWFSQKDADLLRGLDDVFGKMCRLKPRRVCFLSPRRPVREWNGWLHFFWDLSIFTMGFLFTISDALKMNPAAMYSKSCSKAIEFIVLIQLFLVVQWGASVLLWCRSTPKKRKYKKTESLFTKTHRFREEVTFQVMNQLFLLGALHPWSLFRGSVPRWATSVWPLASGPGVGQHCRNRRSQRSRAAWDESGWFQVSWKTRHPQDSWTF